MRLINCFFDEFIEQVGDKKIFCFGYGAVAKIFLDILQDIGMENKIEAFVDNNLQKVGRFEKYEGADYYIISLEKLKKNIKGNCILITCGDVDGVIKQLDSIEEFDDTSCFSMHLMLSKQYFKSGSMEVSRKGNRQYIPKKIHYCWFGNNPIPEKQRRCIESWKKFCPDYEIIEWNENNYDYKKNQYMYEAYRQKKWGFVPDYARLDIVYNHGGIYLDTDIEILKNLDDLLYQEAFAIFDVQFHVNLGSGFGAMPKNSFIKVLRDYYNNINFIDADGKCDLTTCVSHQHNVMKKYGLKPNGIYQIVQGMAIYPANLNGVDAYSHMKRIDSNTILMHYGEASWFTSELADARENRILLLQKMIKGNK